MSLPSAGHLIVASFDFSILAAISLGSALPVYLLHSVCVSSCCTTRASLAWFPLRESLLEHRFGALTSHRSARPSSCVAQPARIAASHRTT